MVASGIEIAKRALLVNRYAMDVVGHNIANANTEGYSRQRVELAATDPRQIATINGTKPMSSLGTGVMIDNIKRLRNEFFDEQARSVAQDLGFWQQQANAYSSIEAIFNEPSEYSLSTSLTDFWNSWQALSVPDPSDTGARVNVLSIAEKLSNDLNTSRQLLKNVQDQADEDLGLKIEEINELASKIAALNDQIVAQNAMSNANDLLDKRNLMVSQLSSLVNVKLYEDNLGNANLAVGGVLLVSGNTYNPLLAENRSDTTGYHDILWSEGREQVAITSGELYGLVQIRDDITQGFLDDLDVLASTIIQEVNAIHRQGFALDGTSGRVFFTGDSAENIQVNADLFLDPGLVAASSTTFDTMGNGENAVKMSNLRDVKVLNNSSTSIDLFYQNMIASLGVKSSAAQNYVETNKVLKQQINNQISSASGVSIDEEMTELIKFQQGYQSAARYLSVMQELFDMLIQIV